MAAAQHVGDLYHLPQLMAVLAEIEDSNGNLTQAEAEYSRATDLVDALLKGFPHPRNKNILVATMGRVFQGHFDLALNRSKDLGKSLFESWQPPQSRASTHSLTPSRLASK